MKYYFKKIYLASLAENKNEGKEIIYRGKTLCTLNENNEAVDLLFVGNSYPNLGFSNYSQATDGTTYVIDLYELQGKKENIFKREHLIELTDQLDVDWIQMSIPTGRAKVKAFRR